MKISNSKQELARIISENGGWRGGEFSAQDKSAAVTFFVTRPWRSLAVWESDEFECVDVFQFHLQALPYWHQTILSREEYFHLYPAQDAGGWIEWDGGECPVGEGSRIDVKFSDGDTLIDVDSDWDWGEDVDGCKIIAYRLREPQQAKPKFCESVIRSIPEPNTKPTIEQLASYYRNAKDYAERKQQEADAAKAHADATLKALELAGEALGLLVSPITAKQEPELVITDWRDWSVDDEVECVTTPGGAECKPGARGVVTRVAGDGVWAVFEGLERDGRCEWFSMNGEGYRFIRRP